MAEKYQVIEQLPWLPSKSCYINLKFFETLKDTPNTSEGFRSVAFVVLEILVLRISEFQSKSVQCSKSLSPLIMQIH